MPHIYITRTSEYENKWRDIKILLNGKLAGKISDGKSHSFEVEPGKYLVQAKIDWCSSQVVELDLKNEDRVVLRLQSGKLPAFIRVFFTPKKYLDLTLVKFLSDDDELLD